MYSGVSIVNFVVIIALTNVIKPQLNITIINIPVCWLNHTETKLKPNFKHWELFSYQLCAKVQGRTETEIYLVNPQR